MRALSISIIACVVACMGRLAAGELMLTQNLDGDLSFVGSTPQESKEKLEKLVNDIANGPCKTLMWSIGAGSDILYYQTKVASTWGWRLTKYSDQPEWEERIQRCKDATEAGLDAPRIVGEQARQRGLKFIPSYRMNDGHYCSDPLEYPLTGRFWMEHQEASIGATPVPAYEGYKHLLNYARQEVRDYRLGVIREAMDRYAGLMDGFELDFNRFQIFFPPGTATENAHHITGLLAEVRSRLTAISKKQKRSMPLIVRVPPAVKNCTWAGLNIETWIQRDLVDVIIPAQVMTLSHDMPLEEFVQMAKPKGVQVYGSLYGRSGYHWPFSVEHTAESYAKEVIRTPTAPEFLGAALNQKAQGVTGYQIYNYILHTDAKTVAALTTQAGLRRYKITTAYFHDREDTYEYRKQLPVELPAGTKVPLRLLIGQEPNSGKAYLRLGLHGANQSYDGVEMKVELNGKTFHTGPVAGQLVVTKGLRHGIAPSPATEAYVQWSVVDPGLLKQGWNQLEITLHATPKPLKLVETEIAILPTSP